MSGNNPLDLTLIPDQREMRFPCSAQLMLSLLWKPSRDDEKETRRGDRAKLN